MNAQNQKNNKTFSVFSRLKNNNIEIYSISGISIPLDMIFYITDNKHLLYELCKNEHCPNDEWMQVKFEYSYDVGTHLKLKIIDTALLVDFKG